MKTKLIMAVMAAALFAALSPTGSLAQTQSCPPGTTDPTYCEPGPPEATTNPATNVTQTTATLNGTVFPNGNDTTYHFEVSTNIAFTGATSTPDGTIPADYLNHDVTADLTGLQCSTQYYYRVVATNAEGTDVGDPVTFQTEACAYNPPGGGGGGGGGGGATPPPAGSSTPDVITDTVTNIGPTSATLHGIVNPNGAATSYTFQYGTTTNYRSTRAARAATPAQNAGSDRTPHNVTANVTGLTPSTLYHYRIVAANANGVRVGEDRTFTTSPAGTISTPRKRPGLTLRVKPRRDRKRPFRYRAAGRLKLPAGVSKAAGCRGRVRVRITRSNKVVTKKTVRIKRSCRYSTRLKAAKNLSRFGHGRMRVRARFLGNGLLLPRTSRVVRIKYGPKESKQPERGTPVA